MPKPTRPTDLFVLNGWYADFPGLRSPHFETLEGIQISTNKVDIVDAGTNKKFKFGTQIKDFGELTLTRTYQGTPDDKQLETIVADMIDNGTMLDLPIVKLHHGKEAFRLLLEDFNIHAVEFPSMDINSEEKFTVTYKATCNGVNISR